MAGIIGAVGVPAAFAPLTTALVTTGFSVGLSYVAQSLAPAAKADTGIKATLQMGGDQPRQCCYGRVGTEGHFIYGNTANENLNYLQLVYRFGEGPHEGLEYIWVNGKVRTLTLVSEDQWKKRYQVNGFVTDKGVPVLYVEFWHGYSDQPYNEDLETWARPPERWTTTDRLAGICYGVVQAFFIDKAFDGHIPRFKFGLMGRRLYDWRRDSTNGGSGSHRWNDEHTWVYSENPCVQMYDFQRGLYIGGERIIGMGVPPIDLVMDLYTPGANSCDEAMPLSVGGEADRYRCGTVVRDNEEWGAVMARFMDSCAGSVYERVGAYGPIVGVAQPVVYPTITDDDLVTKYPVRWSRKVGRAELVNGFFGKCVSPEDQYQMTSYAARTSAAGEAEDGEVRRAPLDFPQVFVDSQAQRLAQIQLNLARLQATGTITLGFSAKVLEPGDWVRWNSARYGDRTYIILHLTRNVDKTVTLNLREISASAYGWSSDDERDAPAIGVPGIPGVMLNTVPGLSFAPITLTGEQGVKIPAVRVYWTPITDDTITAILLEYRIVGATDVLRQRIDVPRNGEYLLTAGLQSETDYEMRATIETSPPRDVVWTPSDPDHWTPVTTTQQVVAAVAPASITPEQFTAALQDLTITRAKAALDDLRAAVSKIAMLVAEVGAVSEINRQDMVRSISSELASAKALFVEQITLAVGPNSAISQQFIEVSAAIDNLDLSLTAYVDQEISAVVNDTDAIAERVDDLEAAIGDVSASLVARFIVGVTPSGALAAYELQATAEGANAGFRVVTMSGGTAFVAVHGNQFYVYGSGIDAFPLFFVDSGPPAKIYLNADVFAPGSVTASHINVATLDAISGNMGELVAGLVRSPDNRLRFDATNVLITFQNLPS